MWIGNTQLQNSAPACKVRLAVSVTTPTSLGGCGSTLYLWSRPNLLILELTHDYFQVCTKNTLIGNTVGTH